MKVLHCFGGLGYGGIEGFVLRASRGLAPSGVQSDFLIRTNDVSRIQEAVDLGAKVLQVPYSDMGALRGLMEIVRAIRDNGPYDVVHMHENTLERITVLIAARIAGVNKVIIHSHNSSAKDDASRKRHLRNRRFALMLAHGRLACSNEAGLWFYGDKPFKVVKNGIDSNRYEFSYEGRLRIREEFRFDANDIVIGIVGRFSAEKNHQFALDVFGQLAKCNGRFKLLLVGDGPLRPSIEKRVREGGLSESAILTGQRKDMPDLFSAMDVLVIPSLFEGFPLTLLEAQASGLPCLVSSSVTTDAAITELVSFIDSQDDAKRWATTIKRIAPRPEGRHGYAKRVKAAGYDEPTTINELLACYRPFD